MHKMFKLSYFLFILSSSITSLQAQHLNHFRFDFFFNLLEN